jgi:hypothetical protein
VKQDDLGIVHVLLGMYVRFAGKFLAKATSCQINNLPTKKW